MQGMAWALAAVLIWSGNFIVAKTIHGRIPPVSLNTYRWAVATVVLFPFGWKFLRKDWPLIRKHTLYFLVTALMGITLFNTLVYIGARDTTAINLALIGTTSSPILAVIFARIFLKEPIGLPKLAGMMLCIAGVLYLLSGGSLNRLKHLHFSEGDLWVLAAGLCFALYNTLVKKKPSGISNTGFLLTIFLTGTLLILPAFFWEQSRYPTAPWDVEMAGTVLYLGIAASVFCFIAWSKAIERLGAGRTAIFGNLIPVFSSIEAVLLLNEQFTTIHIISMSLVLTGIVVANFGIGNR